MAPNRFECQAITWLHISQSSPVIRPSHSMEITIAGERNKKLVIFDLQTTPGARNARNEAHQRHSPAINFAILFPWGLSRGAIRAIEFSVSQ